MKQQFAHFIVAHSKAILIIFIILSLGCGALIPFVNINKDMTKYLPKDSEMRHGLDLMKAEFGDETSSTLEIMFDDLKTPAQKDAVLQNLEALQYAESVDYKTEADDEDHYYNKGKYTRYLINCDYDQYSDEATQLWKSVKEAYLEDEDERNIELSGTIHSANESGLPLWIIGLAVALVSLILLIMASSWVEPATFLITIGIAVLINMGTYVFFPSISKTTFGIVGILQLALSMDYSIMLLNRYRQQRHIRADKYETMEHALALSFSAISGSSLTTFAGLLALVFMSFTMGADVGLALAKGVLISMLCIFTVLPALILGFDSLMLRTAKRTPPFDLPKFSKFQYKMRIPITALFCAMLVGSFIMRNGVDFSYSQSWESEIDHVFGHTNTIVMVYDEEDGDAAGKLAESLDDSPAIHSAVCYESTLGKQRIASNMHEFIDDMREENTDPEDSTADMDLSDSMLKLIYYDYYAGDPDFTMSIPQFVSFLRGDVINDPDFADSIDSEAKDQLDDMAKFTDRGALTTKKSAKGLADFFGMKKSQAAQLLLYYQIKNGKHGDKMTLPDFISFLVDDVASDPEYGKMIKKFQKKQLRSLQPFTDEETVSSERIYEEAAQILGMNAAQMRLIYINHYAKAGVPSQKTIAETAAALQAMAKDPVLSAQFGGSDTAQLIAGLQQIGQMDPAPYDIGAMTGALAGYGMPLDAGTLSVIYAYSDLSQDPSLHMVSVQDLVAFMLEDETISASLPATQIKQLSMLKTIIDTSVEGKKLSAKKMGSILGMKSSAVNQIYLLHQYKEGRTGSWKLTPQQFINFLVNKVLTDKSMRSRIGGSASDLKFAQKLIGSVVAGKQYTYTGMADFFADYSGDAADSADFDAGSLSLLYTLYGSRHYYDETWTMDLMQMVTHLDGSMLPRDAFAKNMDAKDIRDVHDMREDMDEAAELLKGKHYGRMMITTIMEEDSDETRIFMDDLNAQINAGFRGDTYMVGNTPMAYEMSKTFHRELNKITLITAFFILIIVLLTFRQLAAPVILVLIIQCAVFLTMALLNILHVDMQYLAMLIVQSIMMGATIDYAIIYTTYYIENRTTAAGGAGLDPLRAIRASYKGSLQTILTSATILIAAVGLLSFAFGDPSVREICRILSVGSLIATVLVIFILPGVLACLDRIVIRKRTDG